MKNTLFTVISLLISFQIIAQQNVNGLIIADTANFKIIKVWGDHYERGYATGYLDGERMINLYENYVLPVLGQAGVDTLKKYIEEEKHFVIPQRYHTEAQGIVDGIIASGITPEDFDYFDVLAANTFFDFIGFYAKKNEKPDFGCSSLISWGDATASTSLNGSSVISRHVDWTPNIHLINSSSVIAHIPSEENEQNWVMLGFAGQMSALSGVNNSGLAVFQHSLADFYGVAQKNKAYEPIWFTARNALESNDFNFDGEVNTNDVRDAVDLNVNGYANAIILAAVAPTDTEYDSLTALIVESACENPYNTYRYNDYDDLIPGDNLYAANASIKRNDAHNYEPRYMNIVNHIGDGTLIDDVENWNLLRDYSNSGTSNIQFMQFMTQDRILKLSVADQNYPAYQKDPVVLSIDSLFTIPSSVNKDLKTKRNIEIFPNPIQQNGKLSIKNLSGEDISIIITDSYGRELEFLNFKSVQDSFGIQISNLPGIYYLKIISKGTQVVKKLIVI